MVKIKAPRFKSIIEARWAFLFDLLLLEWRHESYMFILECGKGYLPDFYLPKYNIFIEIKHGLVEDDFVFLKMMSAVKEFEDTFYLFNGNVGCRGTKLTAETTRDECNRASGGYCVTSSGLIYAGYRRPYPDMKLREMVKLARGRKFTI